jgi:predicted nucleic acid-binding protein
MIFDTTILIDFHREARRSLEGPATRFLATHPTDFAYISIVTFAEFAEGFPTKARDLCADILRHYAVLDITEPVAWQYADVSRRLRERGERIGDNDLWIAATALAHHYPLVTRNRNDFARIEHLRLLSY